MSDKKKHIIVVGNGMTSLRFCERLLEYDARHEYKVTILGDEQLPAYDRIALSSMFSGKSDADLIFSEVRWYTYHKMDLRLGIRVNAINRNAKTIITTDGEEFDYDYLVMATGARAHVPDIPGTDLTGVHAYRTSDDVHAIRRDGEKASRAIVIGGGLLGLEAAEACREMGLTTTKVEREPHLMACQLDEAGGKLLRTKVEDLGLMVRTGEQVLSLEGETAVHSIRLANHDPLPADLVILATGIQPNDELGSDCGLLLGERGGIAIDKTAHSSDPDIYAIGECSSFNGLTFGLVAPCYAMAEAAAANLGGINKTFDPGIPASQLKLLDLQVASLGDTHSTEGDFLVDADMDAGVYKKMFISPDGKQLVGAILMGETSEFGRLQKCIEEKSALPENPAALLAPIGSPFEPELDLEDDDVVCFCNYVTKGDICKAIDKGNLKTTGDVMGATYAAGLCGSCLDMVDLVTKHQVALRDG